MDKASAIDRDTQRHGKAAAIAFWIEVMRRVEPSRLNRQRIVVGNFGQRFGRKGQRTNHAGQLAAKLIAMPTSLHVSASPGCRVAF